MLTESVRETIKSAARKLTGFCGGSFRRKRQSATVGVIRVRPRGRSAGGESRSKRG